MGASHILNAVHGFRFPEAALQSLRRVTVEASWKFIPAGILFLIIAVTAAYARWSQSSR